MAKKTTESEQALTPNNQTQQEVLSSSAGFSQLADLIRKLAEAGGVPITLSQAPPRVIDTTALLKQKNAVTVAFPPCAEELLGLIRTTGITPDAKDEITKYFDEYFKFGVRHVIIAGNLREELDSGLLKCTEGPIVGVRGAQRTAIVNNQDVGWPSECCLCSPCVRLDGYRNELPSSNPPPPDPGIRRLFIGDLVWLFYFERMGIFQILGAILDAYASNGRLPISNGSLDAGIKDDIVALVLEVMTRQTKMGMSSTVRDRAGAYRTSLGWVSETGRRLSLDTEINTSFNSLFHKFVFNALEFFKDKRLAVAIRGTAAPIAPPSVATLITISDTMELLKKRFEAFSYGRNYYNTLSGIVWAIAGMSVIRELRTTIGIPPAFEAPDEFIPAAYDILIAKRPITQGDSNRYIVHRECAKNARDILLDLEVINHKQNNPGGELELWLTQIEAKIEAYRTAYRTLTGIDLGVSANPTIEQQV